MNYPVLREAPAHDNTDLVAELRDLTSHLRDALERFRLDARVADLAEKEMPDARQRLSHVLTLTSQAAHRTLDLVEQSGPPAERTAREAAALADPWTRFRAGRITVAEYQELLQRMDGFLSSAQSDSEIVRKNLAEVLLAQGYQDLSGQIIRGVMTLVSEVETTLGELGRISRAVAEIAPVAGELHDPSRGFGPAVPGVNTGGTIIQAQDDVDKLFSGMNE
jgi:chemotaxis protein CheZ